MKAASARLPRPAHHQRIPLEAEGHKRPPFARGRMDMDDVRFALVLRAPARLRAHPGQRLDVVGGLDPLAQRVLWVRPRKAVWMRIEPRQRTGPRLHHRKPKAIAGNKIRSKRRPRRNAGRK